MENNFVYEYEDGSFIRFGRGKFDDWCIYCWCPRLNTYLFPRDSEYFSLLIKYSKGSQEIKNMIYSDFVWIYNNTGKNIIPSIFSDIKEMSKKYENRLGIEKVFGILYLGMIAEENKLNARLGKRIKRLGMHQILIDGISSDIAANFSRGKNWLELDGECKKRGF